MKQSSEIDAYIGKLCRELREVRGVSRATLAADLGTTEARLGALEEGRERFHSLELVRIAKVLDVAVAGFFKDLPRALRLH